MATVALSPPPGSCGRLEAPRVGQKESEIDWFEVLKWVLIVLAAGFVGQFGKRLADHLIARSRRRRAAKLPSQIARPPQAQTQPRDSAPAAEKSAGKAIKKSAKAEFRRSKKASG